MESVSSPPPPARPLRVLVIGLSARTGGGGTHLVNQVEALARVPGLDLTVWAAGEIADRLERSTAATVVHHRRKGLGPRVVTEQASGAWASRRYDVLHPVGNFAIFGAACPQAVTIQNAWLFTDEIRRFRRASCPLPMRMRLVAESAAVRASIWRATRVVAVSETMRGLIEADLGRIDKVTVVPSATPRGSATGALPPGVAASQYALVVAHDDPHKEWDRLIETFRADTRLPPLIIVGRPRPGRAPASPDGRVRMLGQIDDDGALDALYRGAACYVAHSRFESVGITPLEALHAGAPVVAADIPAHREVCADAAHYYDPSDMAALADAVVAAVASPPRTGCGSAYLQWTWEDNARALAEVLREAAGSRSRGR